MALDAWLDTKEQVRQAVDIVDLVGSYLPLRRQGRMFVGLCPWHDDTKPSLQINPERQSFKCWVCDIGGDVFSFMMQEEGVEFRTALEMLAERAGISLPALSAGSSASGEKPAAEDKQSLLQAMAWAVDVYHQCLLHDSQAEAARVYLSKRGISPESIQRFRLGYAPNQWDWLLSRGGNRPERRKILEQVGLIVARSGGDGYYDRFRGRVLFPICDASSRDARPIALGGRILPELADKEPAKYINSPETPLFAKNRQVYGLDLARDAISKHREVVVVEGYTDCIMAHQMGVERVVAVLGTALGERHIALLRRFADRITLVLDGDAAGQRRTNEILELFIAAQVNLQILTLPQNLDPCDFLIAHGSEAFGRRLAEATDALEHKIRTVTKGLDITADTHRAHEALEDVLGTLARAPRLAGTTAGSWRLREHQLLSRLSRKFGPPEEDLRRRITELRRQAQRPHSAQQPTAEPSRYHLADVDLWDRTLLEVILLDPGSFSRLADAIEPDEIRSPACRAIFCKCLEIFQSDHVPDFDRLVLESEDAGMKNLLFDLEESARAKSAANTQDLLSDLIKNFAQRKEDARHRTLFESNETSAGEPSTSEADLHELIASLRTRHSKSLPTEG